ncbi:MAG: CHRD domain-containing protein [Pirellulales bacterium]
MRPAPAPCRKVGRLVRKLTLVFCALGLVLGGSSAWGHTEKYRAFLSAANENPTIPPADSVGVGTSLVTFDLDLLTMRVESSFSNLTGNTTASHIHCCADAPTNIGVATQTPTFSGFPLGVKAGSMDQTFDMTLASSYNPAFVTANSGSISSSFQALYDGIAQGRAYLNIHSSFRAGGEIRGYYMLVPEPGTFALMLFGMSGLLLRRRKA